MLRISHEPGPLIFIFVSLLPVVYMDRTEGLISVGFYFRVSPSSLYSLSLGPGQSHPSLNHPLTGRRISLMKASKHGPECPQGQRLYVLLPRLNQGKLPGKKAHPPQSSGMTFAWHRLHPAKPAHRCRICGGQLDRCASLSPELHRPSLLVPCCFLGLQLHLR